MTRRASNAAAIRAARSTARRDDLEPSVPTTMVSYSLILDLSQALVSRFSLKIELSNCAQTWCLPHQRPSVLYAYVRWQQSTKHVSAPSSCHGLRHRNYPRLM